MSEASTLVADDTPTTKAEPTKGGGGGGGGGDKSKSKSKKPAKAPLQSLGSVKWPSKHSLEGEVKEYLVLLAHSHGEFRIPELQAVADAAGFTMTTDQRRLPEAGPAVAVASPIGGEVSNGSPYLPMRATAGQMKALLSKAIAPRLAVEVWGSGSDWETCLAETERTVDRAAVLEHLGSDKTFKFDFDTFGRKCTATTTITTTAAAAAAATTSLSVQCRAVH